jgi:uncharacterized MAPEG superfamily protein
MTVLLSCLFVAMLLPYLAKAPVAWAMAREGSKEGTDDCVRAGGKIGGYDNAHPRAQQARLTGFGARALAAHQNAFESLLIFGLAALAVIATDKVGESTQTLAMVHVAARLAYHWLYLANKSTLRSLSWFLATGCSLVIFCQAF